MHKKISEVYSLWSNINPQKIEQLPPSASPRKYFRVYTKENTAIVAYNSNVEENVAFITFAKHFRSIGINVPEIYFVSECKHFYILEDLGNQQLYSLIKSNGYENGTLGLLEKTLEHLIELQFKGLNGLDLSVAFPREEFDKRSIIWDLHYFKYYFLKLAEIDFNEERLENDFEKFTSFLLEAERRFFLFRDFQTRNIMIIDKTPYFIDFQGGRKGALQYDVASLLYDANANFPKEIRTHLLNYYLRLLKGKEPGAVENFSEYFPHFVLVRMLQALGAFGFRGLVQRKPLFIEAIPNAINNLQTFLDEEINENDFPELVSSLRKLKNFKPN